MARLVSINKSPKVPIFRAADVGMVADLHAVLPRGECQWLTLITRVAQLRQYRAWRRH